MTVELSLLITVFSVVIAFLGLSLNKKNQQLNKQKETKEDARKEAEMSVNLKHIREGVEEIKIDVRTTTKQMNAFAKDLVRVEEAVKTAHKRIDKLEGKIHEN